ncbi:MAG TPA: aldehyde dehydrogenase family protein [Acidimicrobiales bacterium]|nr:aldehyde dehydrogenase family protein [Acidimicrobiales bacterium]
MRDVLDPSTGAVVDRVPELGPADLDAVLDRSVAAHADWSRSNVRLRRDVLREVARLVRVNAEHLARLESAQAGKPIAAARGEVAAAAEVFEFYAGAVDKVHGSTIPGSADGTLLTFREPVGPSAAIVPWNFPLLILCWKVAPALAMGNAVVAKPASQTPLTAVALAELAEGAGLPAGTFQVVTGPGGSLGEALVTDHRIRKVSFTGSTEVGRRIMALAAQDITRVGLELGGKSANVVFDDLSDEQLDACVASSLWSVFDNTGQDCCARSRMFVHESIVDDFTERLVTATEAIRIGATTDEETQLGPLISDGQRDAVEGYVAAAKAEGARLRCGGTRPDLPGSYLAPAVFDRADVGMRFMREEIFGPVVGIQAFATEDEAVALANASIHGLSGSLWCRDIGRALRVARRVETGMLSVNSSSSVHIEAPFGGVKQSGIGRDQGLVALDHFSELKTVFIAAD